ncbi:hypothetical protein B0J18DRAFT_267880 [Chaetomium sp. MPI-SDFR-AT-0129]|nr:hypothetical protein B0J18DRAFT_267880 [Chaetomium sp. MPI-SDFR-AT-0129]
MRRAHRKSRKGCLECKKRHIKCDETRPQCINCTTVTRECQYSTPWLDDGRQSSGRSVSPQIRVSSKMSTPAPTPSPTPFPGLQPAAPPENAYPRVDMVHMELLHHYMTSDSLHPLIDTCMQNLVAKVAVREPYVMHSVLALSAHHLSVVHPEKQSFYHNIAIQLQTQALSLFNSIDIALWGDSVEKRVPAFMFSSVLGIHALCDALAHRDRTPDAAITRFLTYLTLHRGMHTVMDGYWDQLRKTELKVIFDELVPQWFQLTSEGHDCDDIRARLTSADLEEEELKESLRAVDLIQWVFDGQPTRESRAYVLCSWVSMLHRTFVRMLEARRPEALAVLAYYFLAMYHCRGVWLMDGAGQHFLGLLVDYFRGGEWYSWVETPWRMLQESVGKESQITGVGDVETGTDPGHSPSRDSESGPGSGPATSHSQAAC